MRSMTGFASEQGECADGRWRWELRSVNARGLEIRFRTPSGFESQERDWRDRVGALFSRGTVTASLSLEEAKAARGAKLNRDALANAIALAQEAKSVAAEAGLDVAPLRLDALLSMRGVIETETELAPDETRRAALAEAVGAGLERALTALDASRSSEGAQLFAVLSGRFDAIAALETAARAAAAARSARAPGALADKVRALRAADAALDPTRLAQEVALLAVKSDISEELDRLAAHIAAGRALIAAPPPVGRKIDFLTQELNREANTLCAKAQDQALTEIGLELKVVIDQLREQTANVE